MTFINFAALAAAATSGTEPLNSVAEKLEVGVQVLLLGMATVFAVLSVLWIVLALFRVIFYRENKPVKKSEAPAPAPIPAPVAESVTPGADDTAIVAAITAAIAAFTADESGFEGGFRVVSFKRKGNASPWNKR